MKKNIILAGIVAVLVVLVIFLPSREEKKEEPKDKGFQLVSIREPELKKITFKNLQNSKEISIEKKVSGRYIILPSGNEAGNSETVNFIAQINSMEGFPVNLKKDEKENFSLTAVMDKETLSLKIYGVRPFGKPAYYVKTQKGVFAADKDMIDALFKTDENTLRNHVLTDFTSQDIQEFQIDHKRFYQKEEGKWFIQGLDEEQTDSNKVFSVFATISSLRIKNFTGTNNKALYQLNRPLHTLTIKLKKGEIQKYYFSKIKDSYYCLPADGKEILEMNHYDWKYFEKEAKDFKIEKGNENNQTNNLLEDQEKEAEE